MFRRLVINPVRRKLGLPVHYRLYAKTIRIKQSRGFWGDFADAWCEGWNKGKQS